MSGQVSFLTSELQALSKEAGRRHADVKEAADKALAMLKSSPESALSDLHRDPQDNPIQLSSSQTYPVLLSPIVLGCGTKNSKVISIAVSALQRLSGIRGAVTEVTVPLILQTIRTVLSQGVEIQLKILQTLVSLLTNCKEIHHDMLAETLLISFRLQESKIGVVSSTAAATLRQLIMFVFDHVVEEDRLVERAKTDPSLPGPIPTDHQVRIATIPPHPNETEYTNVYLMPSARDAYLVFEDICLLVNGDQPSFLKLQSLPRTFGLELIESVLSDFSAVFVQHAELLHLLRSLLSPLLMRALAEKPSFSTTLRLMRVMYLLLKRFNDDLIMEAEIFLAMFIRIVSPGDTEGTGGHPLSSNLLPSSVKEAEATSSSNTGSSPAWMRILALEILRGLCGDFALMSKVWSHYDAAPASNQDGQAFNGDRHRSSIFKSMITALNRLATEKPQLLGTGSAVISGASPDPAASDYTVGGVVDGLVGMAQQAASTVGVANAAQGGLSAVSASVKLQCIDQLDKSDAPPIPETYIFLLALQCLTGIADGFASSTLPTYSSLMSSRPAAGQDTLPAPPALDLANNPDGAPYSSLRITRDMADAGWPAMLASLSFYLTVNLDDSLFRATLSSFQNFMTTCGVLGLNTPRDAFLISLCKFSVPPSIVSQLASAEAGHSAKAGPSSMLSVSADALGLTSQQHHTATLSTRNLLCLRSLVGVSQALAGSLDATWFHVFEVLQNADFVLRSNAARKQKKRSAPPLTGMGASPQKPDPAGSTATGATEANTYLPTEADDSTAQERTTRLLEVSKTLDSKAFQAFLSALCRLNSEMIGISAETRPAGESVCTEEGTMSPGRIQGGFFEEAAASKQPRRTGTSVIRTLRPGEKSYAVAKLGEVSLMNIKRLVSQDAEEEWSLITSHLLLVQHWQHAPEIVRLQAADVFGRIVTSAPKEVVDAAEATQKQVQDRTLRALARQGEAQPGVQSVTDVEIRKAALDTLFRALEGQGHAFVCGWMSIFSILRSACPPKASHSDPAEKEGNVSTQVKTASLVKVAFPSLQLVCSDFLSALSLEELQMCIAVLAEYGQQTEDVNVALTAGGLLWQVSDHLQAKRRQYDQDSTLGAYLDLWIYLLEQLLELCQDERQEARDGAIQILWRSIELYGASLAPSYWQTCLDRIIFALLDNLDKHLQEWTSTDSTKEPPLRAKQWDDSKILAINSVGAVFADEMLSSISELPTFEPTIQRLVDYLRAAFLHDRPAVATAAMKALARVLQVQWPQHKHDQGRQLVTMVYAAWSVIGDAIAELQIFSLTQANLEAYSRVYPALQQGDLLQTEESHMQRLLAILKGIITYPYSPDYRPDVDVLSPVQAVAFGIFTSIALSSGNLAAWVLEDLAEYATLAFTKLSDTVRSPSLSDAPRKQNQKITYVALFKAATARIVEVYHQFKDEPLIYQSAVERVLAVYSVPLRLKYECPAASKFGEDPPLWKTATLHFLQVVRACISSLQDMGPALDSDTVGRVWQRLVAGFQASMQADCRAALDLSLAEQQADEDFDLAVLATVELHLLPQLGFSSVPADAITSLAKSLRDASRLYDLALDDGDDFAGLASPTMTLVNSTESKEARLLDDYDAQAAADSFESELDGTTIGERERPRERFAYWAWNLLFLMCQSFEDGASIERKRLAAIVMPVLFNRCRSVLRTYLADVALRGRIPFSRLREDELAYTLRRLLTLTLDKDIYEASLSQEPSKAILEFTAGSLQEEPKHDLHGASPKDCLRAGVRSSQRAHLFALYPQLLALSCLQRFDTFPSDHRTFSLNISELGTASAQSTAHHGKSDPLERCDCRELARLCLDTLGKELLDAAV